MSKSRLFILCLFLPLLLTSSFAFTPQNGDDKDQRREEAEDYYKKWLQSDVKYIISNEERSVFKNLGTPEEKEAFIEQFWFRRDTNMRTKANEFKEEHYRRIAFANERFQSGKPGWMTDRGRVYIIHGEPDYIERHPSGGSYERRHQEGGGKSFAYPFEVWYYRQIDGIGGNVDLEFVDPSFSGEYRLALRPEEKDMFLYTSGAAPTIRETLGLDSGRVDRAFFNPGNERNAQFQAERGYSANDTPFARYAKYATAFKAPELKYPDLKEIVTTNITYNDLPFQIRSDFVRLNDNQVIVPTTIQLENKDLTFDRNRGVYVAKVSIYGVIKSMVGRIISEFEDTLVAEYKPEHMEQGRRIKSLYQKLHVLDAGRRYRLDIVVRDQNSNRAGVSQTGLIVPKFKGDDKLMTSSLILSKVIEQAPMDSGPDEMFVLGDIKILPNVGDQFYPGEQVGAYLQVYNVLQDQATQIPSVRVRYTITKGSKVVKEVEDVGGEAIRYYSSERMVLVRKIPLEGLEAGAYRLRIEFEDLISSKKTVQNSKFTIVRLPSSTD